MPGAGWKATPEAPMVVWEAIKELQFGSISLAPIRSRHRCLEKNTPTSGL